jgi:hypothetical protein
VVWDSWVYVCLYDILYLHGNILTT